LMEAGLIEASSGAGYRVLRKPADPSPAPPNGIE
jgi:hypothetical protein